MKFYISLLGCPIGMFDSLDWSKIGIWELELLLLLWNLFIPSILGVKGWIDPVGDLPRVEVLRFKVIINPYLHLIACHSIRNWSGNLSSCLRLFSFFGLLL